MKTMTRRSVEKRQEDAEVDLTDFEFIVINKKIENTKSLPLEDLS